MLLITEVELYNLQTLKKEKKKKCSEYETKLSNLREVTQYLGFKNISDARMKLNMDSYIYKFGHEN